MSLRRAGGIYPHDDREQGHGGPSSAPAPATRGRCASASSIADGDNVNAAPPHLPQRTGEIEWTLSSCFDMERVRERDARNYIKQEDIMEEKNLSIAVVLNRIHVFP